MQDTGEHVIITTGEVHLQKCIEDLTDTFARIQLTVSEPIVPFRETIVNPPKIDMVNEAIDDTSYAANAETKNQSAKEAIIHAFTPNKKAWVKIKAHPLPDEVTALLERNSVFLKQVFSKAGVKKNLSGDTQKKIQHLKDELRELFKTAAEPWHPDMVNNIWSFGPKYCGPNILFNRIENHETISPLDLDNNLSRSAENCTALDTLESSFLSGFQLATLAGPLCEEPLIGVAFVVEEWRVEQEVDTSVSDPYGPLR